MGAVLLLVMLPGAFVLFLLAAVLDGPSAAVASALILFVMGGLMYAAREWDAPVSERRGPGRANPRS